MRRSHGFSLIELLITVAIAGILAAIAVPSFAAAVAKSRQVEAKAGLSAIHTLQIGFFAEGTRFGSLTEIGFVNEGAGRYGYVIASDSSIPPAVDGNTGAGDLNPISGDGGIEFFDFPTSGLGAGGMGSGAEMGYGTGNPHYTGSSFEAVAVGAISGAPLPNNLDIWSIDNYRILQNINPGY